MSKNSHLDITIIPLPFWHKLNYFSFCQTFEILFIICVKFLIDLKVELLGFEPQTFNVCDFKVNQSRYTRMFYNIA
jgi:hypothetical protein